MIDLFFLMQQAFQPEYWNLQNFILKSLVPGKLHIISTNSLMEATKGAQKKQWKRSFLGKRCWATMRTWNRDQNDPQVHGRSSARCSPPWQEHGSTWPSSHRAWAWPARLGNRLPSSPSTQLEPLSHHRATTECLNLEVTHNDHWVQLPAPPGLPKTKPCD